MNRIYYTNLLITICSLSFFIISCKENTEIDSNAGNSMGIAISEVNNIVEYNKIEFEENAIETIHEAVKAISQKTEQIKQVTIIAWSLKLLNLGDLPKIDEEVIVSIEAIDKGVKVWEVAYLTRTADDTSQLGKWGPSPTHPLLVFRKYKTPPNENDIILFIKETNFGHNDYGTNRDNYHSPSTDVVKVYSYINSQNLIKSLRAGISNEEKQNRESKVLRANAHW